MSIARKFDQNARYRVCDRMIFEQPLRIVNSAHLTANAANEENFLPEEDPTIYSGTIVTSHLYGRIAFHVPTQTYCLITSKTPENLKGQRHEDGTIRATKQGLAKSYIPSAYRTTPDDSFKRKILWNLRKDLIGNRNELGLRSEKHFRLNAKQYTFATPTKADPHACETVEIFGDGCVSYLLEKTKEGKFQVTRHFATQRSEGHFLPMNFGRENPLLTPISKISKKLGTAASYDEVRARIAQDWSKVSSALWDQRQLHADQGVAFSLRKSIIDSVNYAHKKKLGVLSIPLVSSIFYAWNPAAGIAALLGQSALHKGLDVLADGGVEGLTAAKKKAKTAQDRQQIDTYPIKENCAAHFQIQTPENMLKVCPKMDLERFNAEDFIFLDAKQIKEIQLDNTDELLDDFEIENLTDLVLNIHQMGFSSEYYELDDRTDADIFNNGVVRTMHEQPDGTIVAYAQYRPDACINEDLRLPQNYIDQFNNGIVRIEFDRKKSPYSEAFKIEKNIPYNQMAHELKHSMLFRSQPHTHDEDKERSLQCVLDAFYDPQTYDKDLIRAEGVGGNKCFLSGRMNALPHANALQECAGHDSYSDLAL